MKSERLLEAARHFTVCGGAECPPVVQSDCLRWGAAIERTVPTFVFAAIDAHGSDRSDVRLEVDGNVVLPKLVGSVTPLDPGPHSLLFTASTGVRYELGIIAMSGEKQRIVRAVLPAEPGPGSAPLETRPLAPDPPGAVREPKRSLVVPVALAGVAIAALGVAGYFQLSGAAAASDLRERCGLRCPPRDIADLEARVERDEWVARSALGVSVVALLIATYLYLR